MCFVSFLLLHFLYSPLLDTLSLGADFEYSTQAYTGYEPTSMRAIRARYNPYLQTRSRMEQLRSLGHSTDKVEFIVMGGTFLAQDPEYRYACSSHFCSFLLPSHMHLFSTSIPHCYMFATYAEITSFARSMMRYLVTRLQVSPKLLLPANTRRTSVWPSRSKLVPTTA